jgi:benzodiazapine receptor
MEKLYSEDIAKLAISVIVCLAPGLVGSVITAKAIPTWYAFLNKPAFTPPNWLFAPVWTALYVMMGVALFLIWRKGLDYPGAKAAIVLFFVQLILNGLWTPVFFGLRSPLGGLVVILVLWVAILVTFIKFFPISRTAAGLLIPYEIWVTYASALNFGVYLLKRPG